jgi:hypothetical protein
MKTGRLFTFEGAWPAAGPSSSNGAAKAPFLGLATARPGGRGGGIADWKEGMPAGSSSFTAKETDSLKEFESAWRTKAITKRGERYLSMEQCERKEPGQARRYKFTGKEQTPVPLSRQERHLSRRIDAVHRKELVQSLELRVYGLEFIGFRPAPSNRRRPSQRTHQSAFHRPCRGNRSAQRHQSGPAARIILSAVSSSLLSFLSSLSSYACKHPHVYRDKCACHRKTR